MIKAIEKARSLARIAQHSGAQLSEFVLTLNKAEAFELLDYLGAGGMGWFQEHERLQIDIALAKANDCPFEVLEHFNLLGFPIRSLQ